MGNKGTHTFLVWLHVSAEVTLIIVTIRPSVHIQELNPAIAVYIYIRCPLVEQHRKNVRPESTTLEMKLYGKMEDLRRTDVICGQCSSRLVV